MLSMLCAIAHPPVCQMGGRQTGVS